MTANVEIEDVTISEQQDRDRMSIRIDMLAKVIFKGSIMIERHRISTVVTVPENIANSSFYDKELVLRKMIEALGDKINVMRSEFDVKDEERRKYIQELHRQDEVRKVLEQIKTEGELDRIREPVRPTFPPVYPSEPYPTLGGGYSIGSGTGSGAIDALRYVSGGSTSSGSGSRI